MSFVAVKTEEQQARGMLFRTRDLLVRQRTQTINALRGHLAEFGVVAPKGPVHIDRLASALEDRDTGLPEAVRELGGLLFEQIAGLNGKIGDLEREIHAAARLDEDVRRLMTVPGIGPITAMAIQVECLPITAPPSHKMEPPEKPGRFTTETYTVVVTREPPTVPEAPEGFGATPVSPTQIYLYWTAPSNFVNSGITGYEYRVSTDGGRNWSRKWQDIQGSGNRTDITEHTVHWLDSANEYTFQVRAENALGGGLSASVKARPGKPAVSRPTLTIEKVTGKDNIIAGKRDATRRVQQGSLVNGVFVGNGTYHDSCHEDAIAHYRIPNNPVTLFYLYWEPRNAERFPLFVEHRREIDEFSERVARSRPSFRAMSYAELWCTWSENAPSWLTAHLDAMRARYEVDL